MQVVINFNGKSRADGKYGVEKKSGAGDVVQECDIPFTCVGQGASPGEKGDQRNKKFGYNQCGLPKMYPWRKQSEKENQRKQGGCLPKVVSQGAQKSEHLNLDFHGYLAKNQRKLNVNGKIMTTKDIKRKLNNKTETASYLKKKHTSSKRNNQMKYSKINIICFNRFSVLKCENIDKEEVEEQEENLENNCYQIKKSKLVRRNKRKITRNINKTRNLKHSGKETKSKNIQQPFTRTWSRCGQCFQNHFPKFKFFFLLIFIAPFLFLPLNIFDFFI